MSAFQNLPPMFSTDGSASDHDGEAAALRHPMLARLEDALRHVTWDLAMPSMLRDEQTILVLLPTVVWMTGPSDHPKSSRGLLPYPISWPQGPVLLFPSGAPQAAKWTAQAWGVKVEGALTVASTTQSGRLPTTLTNDQLMQSIGSVATTSENTLFVDHLSMERQRQVRSDLQRRARAARWQLHELLQPWLRRSLDDAHRAVSAELHVPRVLDPLALDDLFNQMHLGEAGQTGFIDKVIDRLATPMLSRLKVDPARYIVTTFRRDAELALRRKIDDPRWLGPALRRFAEGHPDLSIEELIERFNDSGCNSERIGIARAMRALQPAVQPRVSHLSMEFIAAQPEPDPADVILLPLGEHSANLSKKGANQSKTGDARSA